MAYLKKKKTLFKIIFGLKIWNLSCFQKRILNNYKSTFKNNSIFKHCLSSYPFSFVFTIYFDQKATSNLNEKITIFPSLVFVMPIGSFNVKLLSI